MTQGAVSFTCFDGREIPSNRSEAIQYLLQAKNGYKKRAMRHFNLLEKHKLIRYESTGVVRPRCLHAHDALPWIDKVTTGGYYEAMKAVGVKVLKARLSEYLRLVKTGETVLVTERDEVVAELRPAYHQATTPSTLEEGLERLAERGEAALRSEEISSWKGPAAVLRLRGVSSCDLLDSLREESS